MGERKSDERTRTGSLRINGATELLDGVPLIRFRPLTVVPQLDGSFAALPVACSLTTYLRLRTLFLANIAAHQQFWLDEQVQKNALEVYFFARNNR